MQTIVHQSYAALNKNVFNCFLKMAIEPADVTEAGRLFHTRGPATAKDQSAASVFEWGTNWRPELFDRQHKLEAADAGGRM